MKIAHTIESTIERDQIYFPFSGIHATYTA